MGTNGIFKSKLFCLNRIKKIAFMKSNCFVKICIFSFEKVFSPRKYMQTNVLLVRIAYFLFCLDIFSLDILKKMK